jgi:multimeric flavodoxin WrbA
MGKIIVIYHSQQYGNTKILAEALAEGAREAGADVNLINTGMIGNTKLIGGDINHNSKHEKIFHFITKKGTFTYNEASDEFKSKLQIR